MSEAEKYIKENIDNINWDGWSEEDIRSEKVFIAHHLQSYHESQMAKMPSDTFDIDATALSKSDQVKFMMLLNSGVIIKQTLKQ